MSRFIPPGMGWQPSPVDSRDYSLDDAEIQGFFTDRRFGSIRARSIDLREFFPNVESQGRLNSSSVFAVLGLVEYFEARCCGMVAEASRLFLYQMALRLRGTRDDIGVDLRTTFKALVRFGTPPDHLWRYDAEHFQRQPVDPFLFGFARDYQDIRYFRLDQPSRADRDRNVSLSEHASKVLANLKSSLTMGFPFTFGYQLPSTLSSDGLICNSVRSKMLPNGHATLCVGFDDTIRIASHKGALLIRNSWGSEWGDNGYGWLPYDLVKKGFATDFWLIASPRLFPAALDW